MRRQRFVVALVVAIALPTTAFLVADPGDMPAANPAAADLATRNRDIAFYEKRSAEDPLSAEDNAQLAGLYLQRARETGDYEDFRRAERSARTSWGLREDRNGKALHMLASAELAQHKFDAALASADQLVAIEPLNISYRALRAEIQLELGRYLAADASFSELRAHSENLAVAPRLARWHEINGRPGEAKRILYAARDAATRTELPREQIAWFYLRTADFELRNDNLRKAQHEAEAGLEVNPGDVRLIGLLAAVAFAREDFDRTVALIEPIIDRADIRTLALLANAYAKQGGTRLVTNLYDHIEKLAAANPEPFNRQWTQFRLDHGIALPETVALLEKEIEIRPDLLGWDQLAWGYYLTGRKADARNAIANALRTGTQDKSIRQHAAIINDWE